jgi:lipoate-protein ligase A
MLRVLDRTLESPAENLAFDESLLDAGHETLRFWESPVHFVVLGRSGRLEEEVNVAACEAAGIPVLRRSSGGGTVLQGPGCLNYALALSLAHRPALLNVPDSYRILLSRVARALRLPELEVRGSDILLRGRKVSGNAQRRTKGWLLHHGTILHGLDIHLMERFLPEPQRRPSHRGGRTHGQFVATLCMTAGELKQRVASVWSDPQCPHIVPINS